MAIETSCRRGSAAVGIGDELAGAVVFPSDRRHATELLVRLDALLAERGLRPGDVREVYVSVGPGSFTGLRVGVTVARTMTQLVAGLRCVAVPTIRAVAEGAAAMDCPNLGVVMDAKGESLYAGLFVREAGRFVPAGDACLTTPAELLAAAGRPIVVIGEALAYHNLAAPGVSIGPEELWLPSAEAVWRIGREMARQGQFVPLAELRPLYTRKPEAVRLWEARHPSGGIGDEENT